MSAKASDVTMRTPLKRVRYLGSAKEGADHFWRQRVTGVASLVLTPIMIALAIGLIGADHATVRQTLGHPLVATMVILFVATNIVHMRIGMQVIIEDYVHGEGTKIALLMLNTFFSFAVGAACVFAVLRLSFGA
jgi:succinate dehydrogenase / fumarate reductase membrane anchor subunit